jgi:hypothetical protein
MLDPRIYRDGLCVELTYNQAKEIHSIIKSINVDLVYSSEFDDNYSKTSSSYCFGFFPYCGRLQWMTGGGHIKIAYQELKDILTQSNNNIIKLKIKNNKRKLKVLEF